MVEIIRNGSLFIYLWHWIPELEVWCIKRNFLWAFVFNLCMIPLAAGVLQHRGGAETWHFWMSVLLCPKTGDPCGLWWPVVLLSDVQILGYFRTYSSNSIELVHWRASCRYPFAPCSCSCCNGLFLHYGGLWVECPMQPLNDGELYAQLSTIPSIVFCWFDMFDFGCAWPGLNLIREG